MRSGARRQVSVRTKFVVDERYAGAWDELWLKPGAPREVIDAAYRALSRKYHPDSTEFDGQAQQRLNDAYRKLTQRKEHPDGEQAPADGPAGAGV